MPQPEPNATHAAAATDAPARGALALATAAAAVVFVHHARGARLADADYALVALLLLGLLSWALALARPPAVVDAFYDPYLANHIPLAQLDDGGLRQLANMPNEARALLEPHLDQLIRNARGESSDEGDKAENLEGMTEDAYKEARDPYVGAVARVAKKDPVGNVSVEDEYTLDEKRFAAMKVEYKRLDTMLAALRRASPQAYQALLGSVGAGGGGAGEPKPAGA